MLAFATIMDNIMICLLAAAVTWHLWIDHWGDR